MNSSVQRKRRGLLWWLPPSVAAFIYTVLLKPKPLRALAQKLICRIIPKEIEVKGVNFALNQADAIVSGNLAMGCYETSNLDIFQSLLKPGMCVFDVGANIGLYTGIAAHFIGEKGTVIAVEPDATNCSFIAKTIAKNAFGNALVFQKAAGEKNGEAVLYLCDNNKADHRVYDQTGTRKKITIDMTTLDAIWESIGRKPVDVMKIDTQGFEPFVFKGMSNLLNASPNVKIMMEFWPWGIKQAGGTPRQFLDELIALGFSIQEISADREKITSIQDLDLLASQDLERQHTNLFLQKL